MTKGIEKIAFIGGGNMGGAIIRGFVSKEAVPADRITVCCKEPEVYPAFRKIGVQTAESIADAVCDADCIFLCVKPNAIREVVAECCASAGYKRTAVFVSIAASVPIAFICEAAGSEVPVIRTMPNMTMQIGDGAIAVCKNNPVDNKTFAYICRLFSSIATVSVMEEELLNPIISVNGSSPAYIYLFIQAMLEGAAAQGISEKQALPLILRTIVGAAKMVEQSDLPIEEQIRRVCSPGGTTLEAMKVLNDADFCGIVNRAMQACTRRADEISAELKS